MVNVNGSLISLSSIDSRKSDCVRKNSLGDNNDHVTRTLPDGGWGWVVVGSVFLFFIILGGLFSGFSILYVEWVDYFRCDRGRAGWIGSIYAASGNMLSEYATNIT